MTVKFADHCGGETVMEHVTALVQLAGAIEVTGLLDGVLRVDGARVASVDFTHGVTRLVREGTRSDSVEIDASGERAR